jgi:cytochrome c-type biogenesis protein CcsB
VTDTLASYSLVAIWSAMAIYLFAFIAFTLDLAKRASSAPIAVAAPATATVGVLTGKGGVATLDLPPAAPAQVEQPKRRPSKFERVAFALTILGWVIHVFGDVLRGVAAGRVPWANMFEFTLTATAIIVGVFIVVQIWQDLKFLGAYITGFALIVLGIGTTNFYVPVVPLPPALQSYWLVIHVFVATLGTAFFAITAGLSVVQLLQARRESNKLGGLKFMDTIPGSEKLENLAYRVAIVGFVFWTFTLIAGAIWAEHAWGRYWGWDTKEVWTFIIWTIFAGYIHARATRGWRGSRSAWLAIIGFVAVMFNFSIVNIFFKGLHAYSGL